MAVKRRPPQKKTLLSSVISAVVLIIALIFYFQPEIEYYFGQMQEDASADSAPTASTDAVVEEEAEVYFFDVGQGDSILIRVGAYTMLIDASIRSEADTIIENLNALGVSDLDVVVATHPHADHIGGMTQIIETYPIETFYMPVLPDADTPTTKTYENMLDALEEQNVTVKRICDETELPAPENASFEVYSPYDGDEWEDTNDYSAVIRFTYGDISFMLTGDAEKPVEERILEIGADISSQILKCGHHGSSSSTSPEFLRAVDPAVAIISCGKDNDYGHPHDETMESLNEQGCQILQTWEDGTVLILTNGTGYSVNTWSAENGSQEAA